MTPARSSLQELAEALAEVEFVNQYGHPWCLSDHGAMQVARAVAAHLARPETVERMVTTACNVVCRANSCSFPSCGCGDGGMRAAVAAVVGEAGNG